MASFFGFGPTLDLDLTLTPSRGQSTVQIKRDSDSPVERVLLYTGSSDVTGVASLKLPAGKKYEHGGIKLELIGQIELAYDKSNSFQFIALVQPLEGAGTLMEAKEYPFKFAGVEKTAETYHGVNVRLRYFVRLVVSRAYSSDLIKECESFS